MDRGDHEPADVKQARNWRNRRFAFAAIAVFWLVMIVGITGAG
ncbi:MAG: hypothetical protein ABIP13_07000 [Tepidiformaceae bacterium]